VQKIKNAIAKLEVLASCAGFTLMVLMVAVNVVTRYVLGFSFVFSEEIAYLGFIYSVFFGICIVYRKKAMVSIDIIVDHFPVHIKNIIEKLIWAFLTVVNSIMVVFSIRLVIKTRARVTPFLQVSYAYIYAAVVICFILLTFYSTVYFIEALRGQPETVIQTDSNQ
jgi:TRAP-type C4-dicarboxylate transport system permease small subunit